MDEKEMQEVYLWNYQVQDYVLVFRGPEEELDMKAIKRLERKWRKEEREMRKKAEEGTDGEGNHKD